jgi:prepilin-type N-terminal cleavage/methylation domain-containing protein/prepilin-type processing-associated H-X9-DG protein
MIGKEVVMRCERNNSTPDQGFTLVELLVVISIIAILASLLVSGLAAAKTKAQSARCKSNLRQIAIAQSIYVVDFGAYPFTEWDAWYNLLRPYGLKLNYSPSGEDGFWRDSTLLNWCPTASYGGLENRNHLDYGFNYSGFEELSMMGLGDNYSPEVGNKAVTEADVLNPANMIAFSDSVAKFSGEKRLTLGLLWIGTAYTITPGTSNGTALAYKRHSKKLNTAFVDTHVESLKVDALFFSTEDQDRRRWFRDDQPHREWIQ